MRILNKSITSRQKTPNPNKNFFQNYEDHLKSVWKERIGPLCVDFKDHHPDALANLQREIMAQLTLFDALYDSYDYFDEVVGATVLPFISGVATYSMLIISIAEGLHALAISIGVLKDDKVDHAGAAVGLLCLAGAALVFTVGCFMKSSISLFTRPLITAIQGFKPQDKIRFYDEDSIESNPEKAVCEIATFFGGLCSSGKP